MALQKPNLELTDIGIQLTNVYVRITSVVLSAKTSECGMHVEYFVNKNASDAGLTSVRQYTDSFQVPDKNGDLRAQSYIYIKTLPIFSDCTDLI
jgi:hypothetical protein